jgi:hypothetical protein
LGHIFSSADMCTLYLTSRGYMRNRTREEVVAAQEHINKRTIVIERAILQSDIKVASFEFIYQKFQDNKWLSQLEISFLDL